MITHIYIYTLFLYVCQSVPRVYLLSILATYTYLKVRQNLLAEKKKVLRNVVLVSAFNVSSYTCLRLLALLLYAVASTISNESITEFYLNLTALVIGEFTYPCTVLSIFAVHNKIRIMVCCITETNSTIPSASTTATATIELPK